MLVIPSRPRVNRYFVVSHDSPSWGEPVEASMFASALAIMAFFRSYDASDEGQGELHEHA